MPFDPTQPHIGPIYVYTKKEIDAILQGAGITPPVPLSNTNPLTYDSPAITTFHGEQISEVVSEITAGIPVIVNGKRYLIALMED